MTDPGPTWAELVARAANTPQEIMLMLMTLRDREDKYDFFVHLVHRALDWCNQDLARNRNELKGQNENQITQHFTRSLKAMGFLAHHETNVNGHCDVTVEGERDMLWLGEAKIFSAYGELLGGYRQLLDRYATGYPHQDRGGLLIYFSDRGIGDAMEKWRKYLLDVEEADICDDDPTNPMNFFSKASHKGTGRDFYVRHMPVALFHEPTDALPKPKRIKKAA